MILTVLVSFNSFMSSLKTKTPNPKSPVILALYPYGRGLAHAVMDSSTCIVESGLKTITPLSARRCIELVKAYLYYYTPDLVILRDPKCPKVRRGVLRVVEKVEEYARDNNVNVHLFSRKDIRASFALYDAHNRHSINKVIALCFPEYANKRPKERKLGNPEPYGIAEFDAISLALTYYIKQG